MTESDMLTTRLQMIRDFMAKQQGTAAGSNPVPSETPFTAPWLQQVSSQPAAPAPIATDPESPPVSSRPQPTPVQAAEAPPLPVVSTAPSAAEAATEAPPVSSPQEPACATESVPDQTPEDPADCVSQEPSQIADALPPVDLPAPLPATALQESTPPESCTVSPEPEPQEPQAETEIPQPEMVAAPEAGETVPQKTGRSRPAKTAKSSASQQAEAQTTRSPSTAKSTKTDGSIDPVKLPNPIALSQAMFNLMEKSQPLMREFMERVKLKPIEPLPGAPPFNMGGSLVQLTTQMLANPQRMVDAQLGLWQDYLKLWQNTTRRFLGQSYETVIAPQSSDRRFNDASWSQNTLFDFIKQSYLLTAQWLQREVRDIEGIDAGTMRKIEFYTRQFIDALAPSNFLFTNPEVLRLTAETGGENLVKGLQNLLQDLERGQGQLKISMTDYKAFELGKNIATTPGKVVFQNDMMQLIQYEPLTETVHAAPLLIIPPWINKYYILDLREKNSFVRYCLEQGHTVFMISWVNPDKRHASKDFGSYMTEGALAALEEIKRRTGAENANVVGYCLGGTLLACLLAWLKVRQDKAAAIPQIASATYLVTMIDFREPGELGLFIDDEYLRHIETQMQGKGYLDAATMAGTFNMLRANDLIWSFVVNNYLLGREPFPFDLLYWNADATNMPAAMHNFYLQNMYRKNKLIEPNGLELAGEPINLAKIKTPCFVLSTRDDHIAPWKSTYAATQIYDGSVKFVLSGSGHIAGVINPPSANKYGYWTNDALPPRADAWLEKATQHEGSWWTAWTEWSKQYQGADIPARHPEAPIIEDAPGSYVRARAV